MIVIPIGHALSLRRFPWVTAALVAACVGIQLYVSFGGRAIPWEVSRRVAVIQRERARLQLDAPADAEARLRELDHEQDRLLRRDLVYRLAYQPRQPGRNVIACAFAHGGWLHLAGNMLFLWLFGAAVEQRLGSALFLALYLGGAAASSLAFGLVHRGESTLLVGASGAVSAALGAFLVCFLRVRVRLFYSLLGFVSGVFQVPAWAAGAAYLVTQVYSLTHEELFGTATVAFSGHVGGFVAGGVMAVGLRALGLVRPPGTASAVGESGEAELREVLELERTGKPGAAYARLLPLVRARYPEADQALCRVLVALPGERREELTQGILLLEAAGAAPLALATVRALLERAPHRLDDRALGAAIRLASESDGPLCVRATSQLLRSHPGSAEVPTALYRTARVQAGAGHHDAARRSLELLRARYPDHPLAQAAAPTTGPERGGGEA